MVDPYSVDTIEIPLGKIGFCCIYAESSLDQNTLLKLPKQIALQNGEEPAQLLEGKSYEYELPEGYELQLHSRIIHPSRGNKRRGRITPGTYVGHLSLNSISPEKESFSFAVEIRSIKAEYRSEYRKMLEDITNECTELLMQHSSPVTQTVTVNYSGESKTLYQRFAFVKSIIDSDDFRNAIHRVIAMPVTAWAHHIEEVDVRRAHRIGSKQLRQMASRSNRIHLPINHSLATKMKSVPSRLTTEVKTDTVDTPENRFVKHVLQEFGRFCGVVCQHIEKEYKNEAKRPQIYNEAKMLEERFSEYLHHNVFREVRMPTALPLNSPVLQRKEGYRKILRVWLMYDLAAKLIWNGFDQESYKVGKRDVATLYEYWLFFKLLRLMEDVFEIKPTETKQLIKTTKDGLGLQLRAGKRTAIAGTYHHKGRDLKIKFNFNRTFSPSKYPHSGSWTQQMRPDYTLSIWPKPFSETEAEEQELIVHVHFDAKYKVEGLEYLTAKQDDLSEEQYSELLNDEKEMQKKGTYKRADLLKMHAYKDAIRRTVGAYVLYPGTAAHECRGFHEIVPGLGAFPISPANNDDLNSIREFIYEIINHFSNRASQRERLSYHQYAIHKGDDAPDVHEIIPEYTAMARNKTRPQPASEATVLVGYYNDDQYEWIERKQLYNIRLDAKGLREYGTKEMGAKYLLLHGSDELETSRIWAISSAAPERISKQELVTKMAYPRTPSCDNYLIYQLKPIEKHSFGEKSWDIKKLRGYVAGHASSRPFAVTLTELSKATVPVKD